MSNNSSAPTLGGKKKLGVLAVTLLIIAASAPLTAVAGGVTTALAVTGNIGIPLGYIVLLVALVIFAVGYAAMSRFITNAGAFYAYISQGLGRPFGVGSSLVALIAYNAMQIGIYGLLGFQISTELSGRWGIETPWYLWVFVFIAIIAILGVNRVDIGAKIIGVLVALEFVVVIIFDIAGFANAPQGVTTSSFDPSVLFVEGVGAVLAFGVAAFMGFESAAIYGEESKNPKTTIARATYLGVLIIGIFYAISSWAMIVGVGQDNVVTIAAEQGPGLFFGFLGGTVGQIVADLASLLFITSLFAALLSFHNAVARYSFSLGREGVLPKGLAKVRQSSGAPWAGSLFQTILAVIVVGLFTLFEGTTNGQFVIPEIGLNLYPVNTMFNWLTNAGAMGLVLLMALVSLAVVGFFVKDNRGVNLWSRMIAPILGFLALGTIFVLILVNFNVLIGDPDGTSIMTWLLPVIIVVPGIIGVIWGAVLKSANPKVYEQIGHGIAEDHTAGGLGESPRGI